MRGNADENFTLVQRHFFAKKGVSNALRASEGRDHSKYLSGNITGSRWCLVKGLCTLVPEFSCRIFTECPLIAFPEVLCLRSG